jgi:triosephosphate isomerase (TIM)
MARTKLICGNWKMHHGVEDTRTQACALVDGARGLAGVEIAIAPVATVLFMACEATRNSNVGVAAQNVHWAEKGAFTGEWSAKHLVELGVRYAIIGHSERRQFFGETDEGVAKRTRAALDGGLVPIVCVGELLDEREKNKTMQVVQRQLGAVLDVLKDADVPKLVVAYEPVWAIGTGKVATAGQAQEVHAGIRKQLREKFGAAADTVRIQYGGSVKPDNAAELMSEPDVDGALVGGASLEAASLLAIAKAAASVSR